MDSIGLSVLKIFLFIDLSVCFLSVSNNLEKPFENISSSSLSSPNKLLFLFEICWLLFLIGSILTAFGLLFPVLELELLIRIFLFIFSLEKISFAVWLRLLISLLELLKKLFCIWEFLGSLKKLFILDLGGTLLFFMLLFEMTHPWPWLK